MKIKFNEVKLPSNKKIGFLFTIIFFVSGFYFFWSNFVILSSILFGFSFFFLTTALVKSELLLPVNKLWM